MATGITYTTRPRTHGATQITIDVAFNGNPLGQLWTWPDTADETNPWHAKRIGGEHAAFYAPAGKTKAAALELAKQHIAFG